MAHTLAWVRDCLGHSSIQTTTMYIHCPNADDEKILDAAQEAVHTGNRIGNALAHGKAGLRKVPYLFCVGARGRNRTGMTEVEGF
jgi:hypothetical protein